MDSNDDIGYMQVHLKIFRNDNLYDSFAINAFDECFAVETQLVRCEHKAIDDPADENGKVVQFIIRVHNYAYTIALLMPVHQSEDWEVVQPSEEYRVVFWCILGPLGKKLS